MNHPTLFQHPEIERIRGQPLIAVLYGLIVNATQRAAREINVAGIADNEDNFALDQRPCDG